MSIWGIYTPAPIKTGLAIWGFLQKLALTNEKSRALLASIISRCSYIHIKHSGLGNLIIMLRGPVETSNWADINYVLAGKRLELSPHTNHITALFSSLAPERFCELPLTLHIALPFLHSTNISDRASWLELQIYNRSPWAMVIRAAAI